MWPIYIALDSWDVSVEDIRSLSGVLCWASKVIEYGMIYVRELYSVVAELGMSSCPKSIGRSTFFEDANWIRRIRLDIGWWLDLRKDYRTLDGAVHGRRISHVGLPRLVQPACTLEIFRICQEKLSEGYWVGTPFWCYAPILTHITLNRSLRHEKDYIASGHAESRRDFVVFTHLPPDMGGATPSLGTRRYSMRPLRQQ